MIEEGFGSLIGSGLSVVNDTAVRDDGQGHMCRRSQVVGFFDPLSAVAVLFHS